ncbi:unnamed protein product [Miscanthus lutarioriparius]|uniref:Uncharacterized protein n=1 Tax=Miscanthus lutarioriparius TaxID=422564 RepID=A0A811RFT2_9POAL|nr:unnamed protein product [Miscanthus lutarioriparius]
MLPSKRGADDLTRFSADNKRNCSGEEATDLSISDIWSELSEEVASKLSRSVVSIALSNGQSVLYASSGIVIERQCNFTKFVTSASLVRALHDSEANGHDKLEIEVRHEGNVAIGFLEEYDLDHEIAVVKVMSVLDVYCMPLNHQVQFDPHGRKVLAVGCDISGGVLATSGTCTDSRGSQYNRYVMFSTCKLSETMQGGALFDFYGNFFGMNLIWDMERPIFLPRSIILERLGHFHTSLKKIVFLNLVKPVRDKRRRRHIGVKLLPHPGGRIKIFGDIYPNGVWDELKEGVAPHICGNLVALASFNGESKLFACTGFFVDYYADKCPAILTSASLVRNRDGTIIEGLMVGALLPNNERCEGKLEHYSLHYNVALVSVKNYNVDCPANLKHQTVDYSKVVAVGRHFEPDLVMAAGGKCTRWSGKLDCNDLRYAACTITKAGIGGPLVDVNGNFMGMNYYDRNMGTPYLPFDLLCGILNYFKTGRTNYEKIEPHSSLPGPEAHIVKDGEKQPQNSWMGAGQSEDMDTLMDQDEGAANNERAAIAKPNRYWYRNGAFSVYK